MLKSIQIAAAALAVAAVPALAKDILTFKHRSGWEPGNASDSRSTEGLDVSFKIDPSPNSGRMYVVARFCNDGSGLWTGGIRVTTDSGRAQTAHTTIRVRAGNCSKWGEHLEIGSERIYIHVNRRHE
jgi:hypothetical protein